MQSMTGYGSGSAFHALGTLEVNIRTVNSRFLEISLHDSKIPAAVSQTVYQMVKDSLERGKVTVKISFIPAQGGSGRQVHVDKKLLSAYVKALQELKHVKGIKKSKVTVQDLLPLPEPWLSVEEQQIPEEEMIDLAKEAASEAIQQLIAMRVREGKNLTEDLLKRLDWIENKRQFLMDHANEAVYAYENRFKARLIELLGGLHIAVDEGRILTEIAAYAEKTDFTEEVVRLGSHLDQFRKILLSDGPKGKKLNFLLQEINREVNTTASKADNLDIVNCVIMIKTELEKMREQVQNLE